MADGTEGSAATPEKKGRGPMSDDARVLQASRKFDAMSEEQKKVAREELAAEASEHETAAFNFEATASMLRITSKLSPAGLAKLRKLIS